jgi:hypothetical protein
MRSILTLLALLSAAPPCLAQDQYDLANALAERGWFDLSEEIFGRIVNSPGLSAEEKAEGEYGLARINITMAERAESSDEKNKLFTKAIDGIEAFRKKFPAHRLAGEALSDIGYLYQSKGKALVAAAKADPTKMDEAEKAFGAAEKLFKDLIDQLKKNEVKRPENPEKDPKGMAAFDAHQEKLMFAKYNYATALFSHAETFKDNPSKHADMKRLLEGMTKFLNDDFMWEYEQYLLAFDAFIYMGRASQILAETSDREKAEDYWRQCFMYLGKPRGLLSDKEARKNDSVREICARALLFEMKAKAAYGDVKRGQTGMKQYGDAVRLAEDFFKAFPNMRFEETGKALRLEQGRLLCKSGQTKAGIQRLTELAKQYKESWVENVAVDILGEYGAHEQPGLAIEAADNYFERGPAYMYRALGMYRKALLAIRKAEDQKYVPHAWYQIAQCYYYMDRWHEASAAVGIFEKPPLQSAKEAGKAAMLKLQCLERLARTSKDKADEKAAEDYRAFVTRAFPGEASAGLVRRTAIDHEAKQQFLEAAKQWEQLAKPGSETFEEAAFSLGFDLYREGDKVMGEAAKQRVAAEKDKLQKAALAHWEKALDWFKRHLEHVDKMPAKDAKVLKDAIGSVMFSCRILTHDKVNQGQKALEASADIDKRFPNADPRYAIAIMALRIDAKVKLGQVQEAEEDLKSLKAKYEKEQIGLDYYKRALSVLAGAFMAAAAKEKDADPEKYDLYGLRAADYYWNYYELDPGSIKGNVDQTEAMAQMLFIAAEQRTKAARAKNDAAGVEDAKKIYARARELYNEVILAKELQLSKSEDGRATLRAYKARVTKCMLAAGQFDEAIKMYEAVTKEDTEMRDGSSWEELADCYFQKASNLPKGTDKNGFLKRSEDIFARLASSLMKAQVFNEHTYRLLYKRSAALFQLDPDQLASFFSIMEKRGYHPKWDADEKGVSQWGWASKFGELKAALDKIVPPKK